jgi:hypothetical protein
MNEFRSDDWDTDPSEQDFFFVCKFFFVVANTLFGADFENTLSEKETRKFGNSDIKQQADSAPVHQHGKQDMEALREQVKRDHEQEAKKHGYVPLLITCWRKFGQ